MFSGYNRYGYPVSAPDNYFYPTPQPTVITTENKRLTLEEVFDTFSVEALLNRISEKDIVRIKNREKLLKCMDILSVTDFVTKEVKISTLLSYFSTMEVLHGVLTYLKIKEED